MVVARAEADGRVHILDRLRDPVRLAAGLTRDRMLTHRAVRRALESLERFGERLRGMPRRSVRAVGTNTLRQAHNGEEFLVARQAGPRASGRDHPGPRGGAPDLSRRVPHQLRRPRGVIS